MTQERRKEKRVQFLPKYELKAKVKKLGGSQVHYFKVNNLSFGGLNLIQVSKDSSFVYEKGETLEIMVYRKSMSIKVLAEVLEVPVEGSDLSFRARIVGIDEASREGLASFLREMAGV